MHSRRCGLLRQPIASVCPAAGPPGELNVVRRIFRRFALKRETVTKIVRDLKRDGLSNGGRVVTVDDRLSPSERELCRQSRLQPEDESTSQEGQPKSPRAVDQKRRCPRTYRQPAPLLPGSKDNPAAAPQIFRRGDARVPEKTTGEKGELTGEIIEEARGVPCSATYQNRFGSLRNAA